MSASETELARLEVHFFLNSLNLSSQSLSSERLLWCVLNDSALKLSSGAYTICYVGKPLSYTPLRPSAPRLGPEQ